MAQSIGEDSRPTPFISEDAERQWHWMMDWCAKKKFPPAQKWAWDKAKEAWQAEINGLPDTSAGCRLRRLAQMVVDHGGRQPFDNCQADVEMYDFARQCLRFGDRQRPETEDSP